mgnify:CR=1 FL=1|jgi:hypothetical protein
MMCLNYFKIENYFIRYKMNCIDCDTTDINYIKRKNHTKCTLCSKPLCLEHAIRAK